MLNAGLEQDAEREVDGAAGDDQVREPTPAREVRGEKSEADGEGREQDQMGEAEESALAREDEGGSEEERHEDAPEGALRRSRTAQRTPEQPQNQRAADQAHR